MSERSEKIVNSKTSEIRGDTEAGKQKYSISDSNRARLANLKKQDKRYFLNLIKKKRSVESAITAEQSFYNYFNFEVDIYYLYDHVSAEGLSSLIYDNRLKNPIRWINPEGKLMEVEGQVFLNRSALMYTIVEKYLDKNEGRFEYNRKPFKILFFDLENFASTNIKDNTNKTLGGDYVINLVVAQIKKALKDFKNDWAEINEDILVTGARYGGDEFIVLVDGEASDEVINKIIKYLQSYIESVKAYYQNSKGAIYLDHVRLKDGEVKVIEVPDNEIERKVFFDYIIKHSVLDKYELKKVVEDIQETNDMEIDRITPHVGLYPDGVITVTDKLEYIQKNKPYLNRFIRIAMYLDKKNSNWNCSQKIISFYESVIIKPTVGYEELYYDAFINQIIEEKKNTVIIFDTHFLKEINNQINIARGDIFLKRAFESFKRAVDFVEMAMAYSDNQVGTEVYGNKGGPRLVFGDGIDKYSTQIIEAIKTNNDSGGLEFEVKGGGVIKFPFGYSSVDISRVWNLPKESWYEMIDSKINQAIKMSENIFFIELIKSINQGTIDINILDESLKQKAYNREYRMTSASTLTEFVDVYLSGPVYFGKYGKRKGVPMRYINRVEDAIRMVVTQFSLEKLNLTPEESKYVNDVDSDELPPMMVIDREACRAFEKSVSNRLDVATMLKKMQRMKEFNDSNTFETFWYLFNLLYEMKKI